MYLIAGLWYHRPAIKLFWEEIGDADSGEETYI